MYMQYFYSLAQRVRYHRVMAVTMEILENKIKSSIYKGQYSGNLPIKSYLYFTRDNTVVICQ